MTVATEYVRGAFTVYIHKGIEGFPGKPKIEGITGFILAGGESRRMGRNKALLEVDGTSIITRIYRILAGLFHEVVIVTNSPEDYDFLPCRKVPDVHPGFGSIAGLHAALAHSNTAHSFVTACDLPFLDPAIVRHLCSLCTGDQDAVVPVSEGGLEPLHAVYAAACKDIFENAINQDERKILDVLGRMNILQVSRDELLSADGQMNSFLNVNTPEEYEGVRGIS